MQNNWVLLDTGAAKLWMIDNQERQKLAGESTHGHRHIDESLPVDSVLNQPL